MRESNAILSFIIQRSTFSLHFHFQMGPQVVIVRDKSEKCPNMKTLSICADMAAVINHVIRRKDILGRFINKQVSVFYFSKENMVKLYSMWADSTDPDDFIFNGTAPDMNYNYSFKDKRIEPMLRNFVSHNKKNRKLPEDLKKLMLPELSDLPFVDIHASNVLWNSFLENTQLVHASAFHIKKDKKFSASEVSQISAKDSIIDMLVQLKDYDCNMKIDIQGTFFYTSPWS